MHWKAQRGLLLTQDEWTASKITKSLVLFSSNRQGLLRIYCWLSNTEDPTTKYNVTEVLH